MLSRMLRPLVHTGQAYMPFNRPFKKAILLRQPDKIVLTVLHGWVPAQFFRSTHTTGSCCAICSAFLWSFRDNWQEYDEEHAKIIRMKFSSIYYTVLQGFHKKKLLTAPYYSRQHSQPGAALFFASYSYCRINPTTCRHQCRQPGIFQLQRSPFRKVSRS